MHFETGTPLADSINLNANDAYFVTFVAVVKKNKTTPLS